MQGIGHLDFGHGDFLAGKFALVERPGGLHDEQPADLDPHREVAEHQLDALAIR
jgi:hypothetical protein